MTLDEFNAEEDVKYEEDGLDFIMSKEIYKQFGDFLVQQVQHGYLIRPKNNAESASCSC